MAEPVIKVEGLSKRYHIGGRQGYDTLREKIVDVVAAPIRKLRSFGRSSHRDADTIWALKDVSFEVQPGEVVGIIGRNGAGKSTLLKILTRITEPTDGRAELRGRVGSLLEVGTGFHPELTGRENIFLSGAILGMTRQETRARLDEIIDFSGVERFIDTPVKRYSSGMRVRLGFAVAAHLQPEILLIDEVLAVGDALFQKKCLGKMGDVAKAGRTVLFVSHNMAAVQNLCCRAFLLESGVLVCDADATHAVARYLRANTVAGRNQYRLLHAPESINQVCFRQADVVNSEGAHLICASRPVEFVLRFFVESPVRLQKLNIGIGIDTLQGQRLATLLTGYDPAYSPGPQRVSNESVVRCRLEKLPLRSGTYSVTLYVDAGRNMVADEVRDAFQFEVKEEDYFGTGKVPSSTQGPLLLEQRWEYDEVDDVESSACS